MDNKPIGIFDSGAGGLTVVREIMDYLPSENLIYLGDTARFPYGSRSPEVLKSFVFQIIKFLKEKVKLIVVACNSSSAAALEAAQEHFPLPILGVIEPGGRAAVLATRNRKIGVIGTSATINSQAYRRVIHLFDAGVKIFEQACPPFADLVEQGLTNGKKVKEVVEEYLHPLIKAEVDTLILGCTHYPLLEEVIQEVMGKQVKLISSAREVAEEVKATLDKKGILRQKNSLPSYRFLVTGNNKDNFLELGKRFLSKEIKAVEKIILNKYMPGMML